MAYSTMEEAMESFRNRYNENEFNCTVNKISSGYVYIVKPKSKIEKKSEQPFSNSQFQESNLFKFN